MKLPYEAKEGEKHRKGVIHEAKKKHLAKELKRRIAEKMKGHESLNTPGKGQKEGENMLEGSNENNRF
jgi:hypothetical protein